MGSFSRTIIVGHLGKDAELKYTPSGAAVTTFSVATSEAWKDKNGERKEQTEWHRVVLWGKAAEAISAYLKKGKQVAVEGRNQTREWEKDGVKRQTTEIKADRVVLLGSGTGGDGERHVADAEPDARPTNTRADASASSADEDDLPF